RGEGRRPLLHPRARSRGDEARHPVNAVAPRAQTRLSAPAIIAKTYDLPESMIPTEAMEPFKPELVSPAMAYLSHECCAFNGELLVAGGGAVMRVAIVMNAGFNDSDMTPEKIAANVATLRDLSGAQELKIETLGGDDLAAAAREAIATS